MKVRMIRNIAVIIIALLLPSLPAMAKDATPKAVMTLKDKSHNFGPIDGHAPASYEFEFENTGDANLVILDAKAECGCTKPVYPKAPIPPGKKGRIKVTFNPAGFMGYFEKDVTIRTNGTHKKTKIKIKGSIR